MQKAFRIQSGPRPGRPTALPLSGIKPARALAASAKNGETMAHTQILSPEMAQCVDHCNHCATTCTATVAHCLEKGGKHADSQHIALMLDCAAICATAAESMARGSSVHGQICGVCADICRQCETDCRSFGDDPVMQECADICRQCAESCKQMAN